MRAVAVSQQAAFRAGAEVELFQHPGVEGGFAPFDVTADGKRFLLSEHIDSPGTKTQSIHVIQNWRGLIKQ